MKLNDEAVLGPLHLEAADLSSGRRLIQDLVNRSAEVEMGSLTRTVLEPRGIFTQAARSPSVESVEPPTEAASTHGRSAEGYVSRPTVVWVPVTPLDRDGFEVLQKFEGTVASVSGDSFVARLVDKTNPGPEEEAEIPLAEVMPGDRELVRPGAVFYWVMGYRRAVHGQLSRSSVIRFQRLPSWSSADVERARRAADTFLSFLDLDRANLPAGAG